MSATNPAGALPVLVRELSERSVLLVSGSDARTWLNGQVTNDVRNTQPGQAVYALVCSPKGRILSDVWVVDRRSSSDAPATFALVIPTEATTALYEHLEHYIIMEDCVIEPQPELRVVSAQGPQTAALMAHAEVERLRPYPTDWLGESGFDVLVPRAEAADVRQRLEALVGAASIEGGADPAAAWEARRIAAGVPRFGRDFGPEQLPQEAGLRERAVSFHKGCYLGQEVVVMLEHRGQVPRALCRLSLELSVSAPQPGAEITDPNGMPVGTLTSVAPHTPTAHACDALGYLRRQLLDQAAELQCAGVRVQVVGRVGGDPSLRP